VEARLQTSALSASRIAAGDAHGQGPRASQLPIAVVQYPPPIPVVLPGLVVVVPVVPVPVVPVAPVVPVGCAVLSTVMFPNGGVIALLWTVQKNGITVPFGAFAGIVKLVVPVNGVVSNETPATAPGVKLPAAEVLVTECWKPSSLITVTTPPGGTLRSAGEKVMFLIVMTNPV
jgi:hypothetical protein